MFFPTLPDSLRIGAKVEKCRRVQLAGDFYEPVLQWSVKPELISPMSSQRTHSYPEIHGYVQSSHFLQITLIKDRHDAARLY